MVQITRSTNRRGNSSNALKRRVVLKFLIFALVTAPLNVAADLIFVSGTNGALDNSDGGCSISEAIVAANSDAPFNECSTGGGADTIFITNDITLDSVVDTTSGQNGTTSISSDITIEGQGFLIRRDAMLGCVIDFSAGADEFRLFHISVTGTLSIQNLRLENGCADGDTTAKRSGGAIFNDGGGIGLITNSSLFSNQADSGGAIRNDGSLGRISRSALFDNSANSGGAFYNIGNVAAITSVTFSGNTANFGGAIRSRLGVIMTVASATFAGNSATQGGGAVFNDMGASLSVSNSIFVNTLNEDDCGEAMLAPINGTNNLSDGSCPATIGAPTNIDLVLQDNGCAIPHADSSCPPTHALLPGSNAVNSASFLQPLDQRGFAILQERDIGAFELHDLSACPAPLQTDGFTTNVSIDTELGDAIICANVNGNLEDMIRLDASILTAGGPSIDLFNGLNALPTITAPVSVDGQGFELSRDSSNPCTLDSSRDPGEMRILAVAPGGELTLRNITIRYGCADGPFQSHRMGGGIFNQGVIPLVSDSIFRQNSAQFGGAIFTSSAVNQIANTGFVTNDGDFLGGGISILSGGSVGVIKNSYFSDNSAAGGGAIALDESGAIDSITKSAFLENEASNGAAIRLSAGTVNQITDSTFIQNSSAFQGGAVQVQGAIVNNLANSTFLLNTAQNGSAVFVLSGSLTMQNNLMADGAANDCGTGGGEFNGTNLLSDGSCPGTIGAPTNVAGLATNNGCVVEVPGGPCFPTVALMPGSNAINASIGTPSATDARGFPAIGARDIGSFEFQELSACPPALQADGFVTQAASPQSLREAMICSNLNGNNQDEVQLTGDIVLTQPVDGTDGHNGLPSVTSAFSLAGQGHRLERDAGLDCILDSEVTADEFRLFRTTGPLGQLWLRDLVLSNGCADGSGTLERSGGGIFNVGILRDLTNVTLSNNMATFGGGVSNYHIVDRMGESTFSGNTATFGGGIYNGSSADIITEISNVTVSGNTASFGGGLNNGDTIHSINNATFSGNAGTGDGGGIFVGLGAITTMTNSIVTDSGAGGDCADNSASFTGSNNLSDGSCPGTLAAVTGFDAVLADNGCTTPYANGACVMTHALVQGSNAIDAGGVDTTMIDQRMYTRNPPGDIGAFEYLILDLIFGDNFEEFAAPP
jgi:predicted outer membrane repeat protein